MDGSTQLLALGILLLTFIVNGVVRRRTEQALRPIPALLVIPRMTGASIERSRPLHLALGSASLGEESSILAVVSADFVYTVGTEAADGDAIPILTTSSTSTLPLARSTLRRAYADAAQPIQGQSTHVRWYPAGKRSLAYAAALSALQQEEQLSGNVLAGRYGQELALILDSAQRRDIPTVAGSDQLDGLAVAYALSDHVLLGEEIFVAPGYLSRDPYMLKRSTVVDRLRTLLVIAIPLLVIAPLVLPPLLELLAGS